MSFKTNRPERKMSIKTVRVKRQMSIKSFEREKERKLRVCLILTPIIAETLKTFSGSKIERIFPIEKETSAETEVSFDARS